mmetsp:Transcript_65514/g.124994  ORF Transcript_65514/g.124994 Transcript_65514/m.124994 type:complete len:251 (-) Transcript_65514:28-780(-)
MSSARSHSTAGVSTARAGRARLNAGAGRTGSKTKPLDNSLALRARSKPRPVENRRRSKSEAAVQKLAKPQAARDIAKRVSGQDGFRTSQVQEQVRNASQADKQESRVKPHSSRPEHRESRSDMIAYEALVEKQRSRMKSILSELQKHGQKTSCWAWYVFPTDKAGNCDPANTRVTATNAARLFSGQAAETWQCVLEKVCELLEERGMNVLPRIDHGRILWFIKFWSELSESPEWMEAVLRRLRKFPWPRV